jgi:hypothetical protein
MPYVRQRVPAIMAVAYVMRIDKCDRAAAMRQIEAAALDGALRWVGRGANRWGWDAEVFRTDLLKLWPERPADGTLLAVFEDTTAPAKPSDIRKELEVAADWHDQPLPNTAELQRLTETLAELRQAVTAAVRTREAGEVPADVVEDKCRQASADVDSEVLASLARGQLAALLETHYGVERLPYGSYWASADGGATVQAIRALAEGTAPSNRHSGLAGTVMVRSDDFQVFAAQYLAKRELAEPGARNSTPHRFKHPVWDLRDVFGWVLDRDPATFGRIHTETDWRSAAWAAKFYTTKFRPEHDPQAEQTLLHTLQRGELVAYDGNNPVVADFWLDKAPQRLRGFAPFLFRREDVLALWPDPRTQISRTPPPITPLSGGTAAAIINSIENDNRFPNWRIWKHIPDVKVYEAVAPTRRRW